MKKHGLPTTQNKVLRGLLSVAVLFYVLVPHVGACHCSHCDCCNHSDSSAAVCEQPAPASCCQKELPVRNETNENDSESCPCLLKKAPDTVVFVKSPSVSLPNIFADSLKIDLPVPVSVLPVTMKRFVSFYQAFESPTSRLPVRIHLLLLVLLN